jgi:hypothetical protein
MDGISPLLFPQLGLEKGQHANGRDVPPRTANCCRLADPPKAASPETYRNAPKQNPLRLS